MARSATARVILDAKDRMSKKLDKASSKLGKFKRAVTPATAVLSAFAASGVAATKAAISYGDEIAKAAKRTGLSTDVFQAWSLGVREAGGSTRDLEKAAIKLNQTIGDAQMGLSASVDAFQALGVEFEDVNGVARETDDVMRDVLDVLSQMPNKAQQALVAPDLLGRGWSAVVDITKDGADGLRELEVRAAATGQIINASLLRDAEKASDQLERMGTSVKAISTSLFLEFAPALGDAAEGLHEMASAASLLNASLQKTGGVDDMLGTINRYADAQEAAISASNRLSAAESVGDVLAATEARADLAEQNKLIGRLEMQLTSTENRLGDAKKATSGYRLALKDVNDQLRESNQGSREYNALLNTRALINERIIQQEAQITDTARAAAPGLGKALKDRQDELAHTMRLNALAITDDETRRQYLIDNLRERASILKEAAAQEGLTKQQKLEADRAYALAEAQVDKAITDDKQKHTATRIGLARQALGQLKAFASLSDAENKKQFERNKKINIALGIADTWLAGIAVMKAAALTPGAAIPGYVQAQLALTVAAGLNAVNQIRKTSFSGGGTGAGASGGGAGAGGGTPDGGGQLPANTGEPAQPLQSTTIYFSGKTADISEVRSLVETISDEAERNGGRVANIRVIGGN